MSIFRKTHRVCRNGQINAESDWRCFGGCAISSSLGAQFSVSHPSVNVHYIGTRNVQLMHCNDGDFCCRLGDVQREIEGVGSGAEPLPMQWGLGLTARENFDFLSMKMQKFNLSKVKFLAFSQYTAILVSKTVILSTGHFVSLSAR